MPVTIHPTDSTMGEWFKECNDVGEKFEYSLKLPDSIFTALSTAHPETPTYSTLANAAGTARSVIAFGRSISVIFEMFSGRAFFATDSKGDFKTEKGSLRLVSLDWKVIALKISLFFGRVFSPVAWLDRLKVISLGVHSMWVGCVVMISFTCVVIFNAVLCLNGLINKLNSPVPTNAKQKAKLGQQVKLAGWETASAIADTLSMPWDNGVVPVSGNLPWAIAGGIACSLSAGVFMLKEVMCRN